MKQQQPQPGHQVWLFHPATNEPVNINNPGPDFIHPRKWRYRPSKKTKNLCGCATSHTGLGHNPVPHKIGDEV
jgi:hypothetical protein